METDVCLDIVESRAVLIPAKHRTEQFSVWRVARERWGPNFRCCVPRHDRLFCGLVLAGELEQLDAEGEVCRAGPGKMIVCGAGGPRSHIVRDPKGVELAFFGGIEGVATEMAASSFDVLPATFPARKVGSMEALFTMLLEEADFGGPNVGRICGCLGEAILLHAAEASQSESGTNSPREQLFLRIRRYVLDRLEQPLTVNDVADGMELSRVYINRLFKEFEGESPRAWIQRHRMSLAAELLQSGAKNVNEVAYTMGWNDPYAFSRAFKRVTGVPPSRLIDN